MSVLHPANRVALAAAVLPLHFDKRGYMLLSKAKRSDVERTAGPSKYYELTRRGRGQLGKETDAWHRLTTAVAQVLESS